MLQSISSAYTRFAHVWHRTAFSGIGVFLCLVLPVRCLVQQPVDVRDIHLRVSYLSGHRSHWLRIWRVDMDNVSPKFSAMQFMC